MKNTFSKISTDIKANDHIDLTVMGVKLDVPKKYRSDIEYALEVHNEMVERLAYLEGVASQFVKGKTPDTSVTKVSYKSGGCYGGSSFRVLAGHGKVPASFKAISETGVELTARKTLEMRGGGHGEGSPYPVETYNIKAVGPDGRARYEHSFGGEVFTITEVLEGHDD